MLPMGRGNTRMPSEGNSVQGQAGKGVGKGGKNGSKNGNLTPAGRLPTKKNTTKNCGAVGVVDAKFCFPFAFVSFRSVFLVFGTG